MIKISYFRSITHIILTVVCCIICSTFASEIPEKTLVKAKKAIVSIDTRISMSAYHKIGNFKGTGFVVDKNNGLVVTNAHVVGLGAIGTYFVTFHTGQQAEAKLVYYDLWQDQAILKIATNSIPQDIEEIAFSKKPVQLNQDIFLVGNNEGQGFAVHRGSIANLYEINGEMPQSSYVINLNVVGGSSGSPVLNISGEAIGLHYGGGQTFGLALKGAYVTKILEAIKDNKQPTRKHIGVVCESYSLDKAVQHRNFPKDIMNQYINEMPDSRNRVVAVQYVIPGSPSENMLQPGDILWAINDKRINADLYIFDSIMDNSADNVKITIYRNGKLLDQTINLYDIESHKIDQMLHFGGAIFFQSDDHSSAKSGIPLKSLTIANVQNGTSFSTIPWCFIQDDRAFYRLTITSIDGHPTPDLKSLIDIVPQLIAKMFIDVKLKNYQPYFGFSNALISSHSDLATDITLDTIDNKPRVMKFDRNRFEWLSYDVNNN